MTDGIVISNGQAISAVVGAVGTITALLKVIQSLYVSKCKDLETAWSKRWEDERASGEKRIQELINAHALTTQRLDARITWLEDRDRQWREQQQSYIVTLERAVEVSQRQTEAIEALRDQQPTTRRRTGGGDD